MSSAVSGRDSMLTGFLTGDLMAVDGQKAVQSAADREVSQKTNDEGVGLSFLMRKFGIPTSAAKANVARFNSRRQLFYDAIVRRFGGKAENIPQSVREAMKLDDFALTDVGKVTSGRPLSDRRIGLVSASISKHLREAAVLKELTGVERSEILAKLGLKPSDSIPPRLKAVLFLVAGRADLAHEVGKLTKEMADDIRGVYKAMRACEDLMLDKPGKQGCGVTIHVGGKSVEVCLNRKDEMSDPKLMLRICDDKDGSEPVELDFPALSLAETKDRVELDIVDNLKSFPKDDIRAILEQAHKQNKEHSRAVGLRILAASGYSTSMFANLSEQLVFTLAETALCGSLGEPAAVAKFCRDVTTTTELGINDKETLEACERLDAEIKSGRDPQVSKAEQSIAEEDEILAQEAALTEKEKNEKTPPSAEELSKRINLRNQAAEIRERRVFREEASVQNEIKYKRENIQSLKDDLDGYSADIKSLEGEIEKLQARLDDIAAQKDKPGEVGPRQESAKNEEAEPTSVFSLFGAFAKAVKSAVDKAKTPEQLQKELDQKKLELADLQKKADAVRPSIEAREAELEKLNGRLSELKGKIKGYEELRLAQNVKDMMADMLYDADTLDADSVLYSDPSLKEKDPQAYEKAVQNARLAKVIKKHADTIFQVVTGRIDAKTLPIPDEYKGVIAEIKAAAEKKLKDLQLTEKEREQLNKVLDPKKELSGLELFAAKGAMLDELLKPEVLTEINERIDSFAEAQMDELAKDVKNRLDDVFGTEKKDGPGEGQNTDADGKPAADNVSKGAKVVAELKKNKSSLSEIVEASVTDTRSGQGAFLRKSILGYFEKDGGLSRLDRRAMLAAGIRYAPRKMPENETQKAGLMLGALFKGAGPILQKTLQGLDLKVLPLELQLAVIDIKDNLAPIPDKIVKAHLNDIIARSKGHFTAIQVEKSLGAASVGQALLCTFTDAKGNKSEKVVKILRPDVKLRIERERKIFEKAAAEIPGMSQTFQGQLERILDELDLTIEARNVEKGLVSYDDGTFSTLTSMKLDPNVPPTNNVMVLEKAPGTTLSRYIQDAKEQLQELKNRPCGITLKELTVKRKALGELAAKLRKQLDMLANLSLKWVTDGLYGNGFFHGDLHAGNIMVDGEKLTVIDFGNATTLTKKQQAGVMKMMTGASIGKTSLFLEGYRQILSADGLKLLDKGDNAAQLKEMISYVLKQAPVDKGGDKPSTSKETGQRIFAILTLIQKMGLEAPGPIFNFSQGQIRLQNSMSDIAKLITDIGDAMASARPTVNGDGRRSDDVAFRSLCRSAPEDLALTDKTARVSGDCCPTFVAGLNEKSFKDESPLEKELYDGGQIWYNGLVGSVEYEFGGCSVAKGLNMMFANDGGFNYGNQKFNKEKCLDINFRVQETVKSLKDRLTAEVYNEIEDARKAFVAALDAAFANPGDVQLARTLRHRYNDLKFIVLAKRKKDIVREQIISMVDFGSWDELSAKNKFHYISSAVYQMGGSLAIPEFRTDSKLYKVSSEHLNDSDRDSSADDSEAEDWQKDPDKFKAHFIETLRKAFDENDLYSQIKEFAQLHQVTKEKPTSFVDVMGSVISSNLSASISNLGILNTIVNIGSLSSISDK